MESNIELMNQAETLFHQIITLDLTVKTLEIDINKLAVLKVNKPLIHWYEQQISVIHKELYSLKSQLGKLGGKIDSQSKDEGDFHVYTLIFRNTVHPRKYFKIVLKNLVEKEIAKRLGLDDITNSNSQAD